MIHYTRASEPLFPPKDGRIRTVIGGLWVDWDGAQPSLAELQEHINPTPAPPQPDMVHEILAAIAGAKDLADLQEKVKAIKKK